MKDWFQGLSADLKSPKARKQREKLRRIVFVAVTALTALAIAFFAGRVSAEEVPDVPMHVHESDGVHVKLMRGQCSDAVTKTLVAMLPPQFQVLTWRHVESTWLMQNGMNADFAGCWAEEGDYFLLLFNDMSEYKVKKSVFKRTEGQTGV